jgi:cardiolipin synthase
MNWHIISTVVLIAHWTIVIALALRVIMRRRPVGVALAWLAVLFSLPLVGVIVYLLFGEKRLGKRRAARLAGVLQNAKDWQAHLRAGESAVELPANATGNPLDRHAAHVVGFPALAGNTVTLIDNFHDIFDAIVADIDAAQRSCWLGFYIWHEGGRTDDVVEALIRAAKRGVACRISADAMGSKAFLKGRQIEALRNAQIEVVTALPTGLVRSLFVRADLRNHRKIVVIDNRIAYTGSQNLVDPRYFKQDAGVGQWVDAMARMEGAAVSPLAATFLADWCVESGEQFDPAKLNGAAAFKSNGPTDIQVVPSGPGANPEVIHQLLLTTMYAARRELVMTTPYFVPEESMLTALLSAALRGVEVTIIVPAENDSMLVRYASVAHFDDLVSAGVRVARFRGGLLHTKSITVDGQLSVFGSVNLDMRSLWLNFEISLLVYDEDFTARLRALQQSYLADADLLDLDVWRSRGVRHKLAENTFRLLAPLL